MDALLLNNLTGRQARAAALHWCDGLAHRAIGARMGCSQPAVLYLLRRARRNLARVGVRVEVVERPRRPRMYQYHELMDFHVVERD